MKAPCIPALSHKKNKTRHAASSVWFRTIPQGSATPEELSLVATLTLIDHGDDHYQISLVMQEDGNPTRPARSLTPLANECSSIPGIIGYRIDGVPVVPPRLGIHGLPFGF